MTTRILIVDDHAMLRAGLRTWLNSVADFEVVAEAGDGGEAVVLAQETRPDVVLMDISVPGPGSGIVATRRVKECSPDVQVLILTVHEDEDLLREAMRSGASGYLVKRAVQTELIDAIRAVARGDIYIHPAMTRSLIKDMTPARPEPDPSTLAQPIEPLTPREIEVACLIARGYTSREIAKELWVSARTVDYHRANLMSKLGLRSRVELIRYVESHGLMTKAP